MECVVNIVWHLQDERLVVVKRITILGQIVIHETGNAAELNKADAVEVAQRTKVDPASVIDFCLNIEYQRHNVPDFPAKPAEFGEQFGFRFVQI